MFVRSRSGVKIGVLLAAVSLGGVGCVAPPGGDSTPNPPSGSGSNSGSGGSKGNGSSSGGNNGGMSSSGTGGNSGGTPSVPAVGDPGRVTIRRMNRAEYDNTVRDLLGIDLGPAKMFDFVEDEWGDTFNNDADVLTLAPLSIEKYLTAAQFLIDKVFDPANAAAKTRVMVCTTDDDACTKRILGEFGTRAFRRPLENGEVDPYAGLVKLAKDKGENFEAGLKVALAAFLVAPDFLFRVEGNPEPGKMRALNDYELASRLSYFLWASMPDAELFDKAKQKALTSPDEIKKQVGRMLKDDKAQKGLKVAMIEQWMNTIALQFSDPDVKTYANWQKPLLGAMEQEVRTLVNSVLTGDASSQDLINSKYVYANQALAKFYGLPDADKVPADSFQKVNVTDGKRGGVIRQGAFLVSSSHPTTHSPTRRGVWILERLLCTHPPAPPAMVPAFEPGKIVEGTLRKKLETAHVGMGNACKGCHAVIDPMGFALEHYDGSGSWRDMDNGEPVDSSGEMPGTGEKFNGADDLANLIAKDKRFASCMAQKVLTYALGRKMTEGDKNVIEEIGGKFSGGGFKFPSLVELVAQSSLMTNHRADKE